MTYSEEKQPLSSSDIVNILAPIKDSLSQLKLDNLKRQLMAVKIYPSKIERLKQRIYNEYHKSRVEPGTNVGVIAAQSIGEISTQLTMNTKHAVGQSEMNVTLSFPRFDELIRAATKKHKCNMVMCFKNNPTTINDAYEASRGSGRCTFDMVKKYSHIWHITDDVMDLPEWVNNALYLLYNVTVESLPTHIFAEITLDPVELYKHRLTPAHVAYKLAGTRYTANVYVIPSPEYEHKILLLPQKKSYPNTLIKMFDRIISSMSRVVVSSIRSIKKMNVTCQPSVGKRLIKDHIHKDEWVIETTGSCLQEVIAADIDSIDIYRTVSTNINEIYQIFGVEAARTVLIQELNSIVEFGGATIDSRHILLLADSMTRWGRLDPVTRDGFNKSHYDTLSLATFEKTLDHFVNSATWGQRDSISSVSSNLIMGQLMKAGTGGISMVLDIDALDDAVDQKYLPSRPAPVYTLPKYPVPPHILAPVITEHRHNVDYSVDTECYKPDTTFVYNPFTQL